MTAVNLALSAYPVGSIYMSVNATSPATLFGGTWERIQGRFLLAATDGGASGGNSNASIAAGNTGGEASHTLTAAESGVPAHGHGHSLKLPNHVHSMAHTHTYIQPVNDIRSGLFLSGTTTWSFPWTHINGSGPQENTSGSSATNTGNPTSLPSVTGSVSNNTAANASSAHNNMPPYLAVYVWKRTA